MDNGTWLFVATVWFKRVAELVLTKYWHELQTGRIQCDLWSRFCPMRKDKRGLWLCAWGYERRSGADQLWERIGDSVLTHREETTEHFPAGYTVLLVPRSSWL